MGPSPWSSPSPWSLTPSSLSTTSEDQYDNNAPYQNARSRQKCRVDPSAGHFSKRQEGGGNEHNSSEDAENFVKIYAIQDQTQHKIILDTKKSIGKQDEEFNLNHWKVAYLWKRKLTQVHNIIKYS
jgi:hypothetical protein